jgi:hypothetical protein
MEIKMMMMMMKMMKPLPLQWQLAKITVAASWERRAQKYAVIIQSDYLSHVHHIHPQKNKDR